MSLRAEEHRNCIREELEQIRPGANPTPEAAYMKRVCLLLADILEELEERPAARSASRESDESLPLLERLRVLFTGRVE